MKNLHDLFTSTSLLYIHDEGVVAKLWNKIEKNYTGSDRHYHNLTHLESLYRELEPLKNDIRDWDVVVFALFYHDVIYQPLRSDNEEKSASLAASRLAEISFPEERIAHCSRIILATKGHQLSGDNDTNIFTDADLAILGSPYTDYQQYARNIRKEYRWVPDFMYNPGRKKILNHFLRMDDIYKTEYFSKKYEAQARLNLEWELRSLA